jgi:hypothetical protein
MLPVLSVTTNHGFGLTKKRLTSQTAYQTVANDATT